MADATQQTSDQQITPTNDTIQTSQSNSKVEADIDEDMVVSPQFDQEAFQATKNLVAVKTSQADRLKKEIGELRDSMNNITLHDEELEEAESKVKEMKNLVSKRKKTLQDSPEVVQLRNQIKEKKEELKDIEDSLSTQLVNLYQITGVKEFETVEGEVREFDIKAKVKGNAKK